MNHPLPELLAELDRLGVRLRVDGGKLAVQARAGVLTTRLRTSLAQHRDRLVELLDQRGVEAPLPLLEPCPDARYEPFPLTDVQHGYWIGRNPYVELGGVATHFYFELDSANLDLPRLTTSLRAVIDRHDMLRAVVEPDGRQRVLPTVPPYEIVTADLRGATAAESEAAILAVRDEMSDRVAPTGRWPLFEIRATRLSAGGLRLHISLDLLIIDGFSMSLFFGEWRRHYQDPDLSSAPLPVSFRDYVLATRQLEEGDLGGAAREYWTRRIDILPPAPELPLATQPAALERPRFTRRRFHLEPDRWKALRAKAKQHDLTPSALLLAAFAEVLRVWSRHQDCTLNLTMFNRLPLHPLVDEIIGDFTTVTMLEVRGDPGETFLERAARLRERLLEDIGHSAFSGVRVLRELARRDGVGPGAAMPVVFTSGLALDGDDARDFFGDFVFGISQTPQVWLDHQVTEERGELVTNWDAVDDLFPAGVLDDMFQAYQDLLAALADDDGVWRRTGSPVPLPDWQRAERRRANATEVDLPEGLLHEPIARQVEARPDALAIIAADGEVTYRRLGRLADSVARALRALDEPLVAVSTEKGWEQVVSVLGVLRSGAAYLPIDPDWPLERRRFVLAQAGVRTVVTQDRLRGQVVWPDDVLLVTPTDEPGDHRPVRERRLPDDPAYVIFTSGSTGVPKGVVISHRAARNTVEDVNRRFHVGPNDRVLALSALSFDLSVYDVFGVLGAGGTVVLPDARRAADPAHWSELVERHRVTVWNSVPALMRAWIDTGPPADTSLRLVLLSGDWIPVELAARIRDGYPGIDLIGLGGATEASIWSVFHRITRVDPGWKSVPYGKPLANQALRVCNDWLEPCPVWTVGEIYLAGEGVADGYWRDPERTAERFLTCPRTGERLYRTGDLGRYLPGGDIEFLGREDSQVKINGFRIELGEVVAQLRGQPGVREALVGVRQDRLVAYLVPEPGRTVDVDALPGALRTWLPEYMVPHHYLLLDRIPLSPNGKVDHAALPDPQFAVPAADDRVPPRTEVERRLHGIWAQVLGHAEFGVHSDFFAVGGDSMSAVQVLGLLREEFVLDGDASEDLLRTLMLNPTLAELADFLASASR